VFFLIVVVVSVIVLAYGRDRFVKDAVDSVLKQSLPRDRYEIIVVTNLDSVERMVKDLADRVVRHNDARDGYARGIEASNGELVAFLDDDDEFISVKLEHVVEVFNKDKSLGFYHHNVVFIDEQGEVLNEVPGYWRTKVLNERIYARTLEEKEKLVEYMIAKAHEVRNDLRDPFYWLGFNSSSIVMRRDLVVNYLDALSRVYTAQDNLHFIEALLSGYAVLHEPVPLTRYRLHSVGKASFGGADKGMKQWNDMQVLSEVIRGTWLEEYIDLKSTEIYQFSTLFAYAMSIKNTQLAEELLREHLGKRRGLTSAIARALLNVPGLKRLVLGYEARRIYQALSHT
jgi:glycosyltransferase involved in cell wall biosynthesis